MNRPKFCRKSESGNYRTIHGGAPGARLPLCQPEGALPSKWHRLPNNLTVNCEPCLYLIRRDEQRDIACANCGVLRYQEGGEVNYKCISGRNHRWVNVAKLLARKK